MERKYWIGRMRAAMDLARHAATAESRLTHFDMAGRYSVKAAASLPPFLLPRTGPATAGEREVLRLPMPQDRESGSSFWRQRSRRRPDGTDGGPR